MKLNKRSKVLDLLGLCNRARKTLFGEQNLDRMADLHFLFVANDASEKTKERYEKKCHYYGLEFCNRFDTDELSGSIGKNGVKVIGILDAGFGNKMKQILKEEELDGKTDV